MDIINIQFNDNSDIPIYKQIHDQIVLLISKGILESGEKLPSIKNLAKRFSISENTVAKSYRLLELEKYIQKKRGYGAFVL